MMDARTAIAVVAEGSPQSPPTSGWPSTGELVTSAGFGGALALLAAIVIALTVTVIVRRAFKLRAAELEDRKAHDAEERVKKDRAAEIAVVDERFRWVVETAGIEPAASEHATLRLGPELALELLNGLLADAQRLSDETLARGITVYLNQFSLVLAQQGGPLAGLKNVAAQPKSPTASRTAPAPAADPEPASTAAAEAGTNEPAETNSAAADSTTATAGRRRRR